MFSIFDILSLVLLLASMTLFVRRYVTQNPPVYPYLIIACTCLAANWLGEAGGGLFALILLVAAAFSFLGCLLYPSWRTMGAPEAGKTATPRTDGTELTAPLYRAPARSYLQAAARPVRTKAPRGLIS